MLILGIFKENIFCPIFYLFLPCLAAPAIKPQKPVFVFFERRGIAPEQPIDGLVGIVSDLCQHLNTRNGFPSFPLGNRYALNAELLPEFSLGHFRV